MSLTVNQILVLQDRVNEIAAEPNDATAIAELHIVLNKYLASSPLEYERIKEVLSALKKRGVEITCKGGLNAKKEVLMAYADKLATEYAVKAKAEIMPEPVQTEPAIAPQPQPEPVQTEPADEPESLLALAMMAAEAAAKPEESIADGDPVLYEAIERALSSAIATRELALTQGVSADATDLQCRAMLLGLKQLIKPSKARAKREVEVDIESLGRLPVTPPGKAIADVYKISLPKNSDKGTMPSDAEVAKLNSIKDSDLHEYGKLMFRLFITHGCVPLCKALNTTDGNVQRHAAVALLLELSPKIMSYYRDGKISWAKLHYITTNSMNKHGLEYFESFVEKTVISGIDPRVLSVKLKTGV